MDVIIIGAGPAGIACACAAAEKGHHVQLLDSNPKIGKKLFLTGKGRCNLTNNADISTFIEKTTRNPNFMYSSFYSFTNIDLIRKIEQLGIRLKVERGNRVFPESDKSSDVIKALEKWLKNSGVELNLSTQVMDVDSDDGFTVHTSRGKYRSDKLVLATGGLSYSSTGSCGDGYRFAEKFGHRLVPPRPSLVPIILKNKLKDCAGITLKNVMLTLKNSKTVKEFGDMLITHQGISGPIVLTFTSKYKELGVGSLLELDLKPALTEEKLDQRLLRDIEKYHSKDIKNGLKSLMVQKMIHLLLELTMVDGEKPMHMLTRKERKYIVHYMKHWPLEVENLGRIEEAIITRGGIDVKEINPSTMESLLKPNLYFVGEIIDVDALTGGFNLQIAFSTGILAGRSL